MFDLNKLEVKTWLDHVNPDEAEAFLEDTLDDIETTRQYYIELFHKFQDCDTGSFDLD